MSLRKPVMFIIIVSAILTLHAPASDEYNEDYEEYIIFNQDNIRTADMRAKSNIDINDLAVYLENFPHLKEIDAVLIESQDKYNVNMILLLAIIRLESGNGKSTLAEVKNNLGGLVSSSASKSSMKYTSFESKEECVKYMAKLLSESYLTKDGRYHKGYKLSDIAKYYSTESSEWCAMVQELMLQIQEAFLEFVVPVSEIFNSECDEYYPLTLACKM